MPRRPAGRCSGCNRRQENSGLCSACRKPTLTAARRRSDSWHWVYTDPRWPLLRDQVLSEEPLCRTGCGRPPTVVDHIRPHRGNEELAFDRANLQAMCKPDHDAKTAHETGFAGGPRARPTTARVTLVYGAPCSGKTTYVRERAKPGDLVVDWDTLAQALGSPHPWDHPAPLRPFVAEARDAVIARLARRHEVTQAWLIATAPRAADRERIAPDAGARTQAVLVPTPEAECVVRARRDGRPAGTIEAIEQWFTVHRADEHRPT